MGNVVRLENWIIQQNCNNNSLYLGGACFGHTKLPDGTRIHTSTLVGIEYNKDTEAFTCKTMNTLYELKLEDISFKQSSGIFQNDVNIEKVEFAGIGSLCLVQQKLSEYYNELFDNYIKKDCYNQIDYKCEIDKYRIEEIVGQLKDDLGILNKVVSIFKSNIANRLQGLDIKEGELYIKMDSSEEYYAVFGAFKKDSSVHIASISPHIGMFTDSILMQCYGLCDFRYYIGSGRLETYHWSEGTEKITIENIGKSKIIIEIGHDTHEIEAGEVSIIVKPENTPEGLISPDCVNGKNAFFDANNE